MKLPTTKPRSRGSVGLDMDRGFLAAVQATEGRIAAAVSDDLPEGVIVEGEVNDVETLSDSLKQLFRRASLPRNVRLGVSNQQIVVRHLELPPIEDDKERDAAVRFQAQDAIAMPLEEVMLDYQVLGQRSTPEGHAQTSVVVVAARAAMIERIVEAVRGAGLRPEGVDLDAFALVRTLAPSSFSDGDARVYCHLAGVTNLAVALGSSCLFTRTLSTPWNSDADGNVAELADEIRLSIDTYSVQPDARHVGDIVVSGPGSTRPGLVEELDGILEPPVTTAEPLGSLDAAGVPPDEDPHRHTVAAGLALGAAA